MPNETAKYRYRLDSHDRIIWVDALWIAFARENGAAELTEHAVLNRSLWEFIEGKQVRCLFQQIHDRVRSTVGSVILPFRCDSPSLQRHMRLRITREEAGQLLYESTLVQTVPQQSKLLDSGLSRSNSVLTMCSLCKRVLIEPTGWIVVEDAAAQLGLFESSDIPQLRHCICAECADTMANVTGNGDAA